MIKDNNVINGMRKLKIMENRVDTLYELKKNLPAHEKQRQLFHFYASYSTILLNKNHQLFQYAISNTLRQFRSLMLLKMFPFDLKWKKQIIVFLLLGFSMFKSGRGKQALSVILQAQHIIADLHSPSEHYPRNMDYILSVNTLTGFMMLKLGRIEEALDLLEAAEEMAFLQVEYTLEDKATPQQAAYYQEMQSIQEMVAKIEQPYTIEMFDIKKKSVTIVESDGSKVIREKKTGFDKTKQEIRIEAIERLKNLGQKPTHKNSKMRITLLQNYLLAICLMKNIALRHLVYMNPSVKYRKFYRKQMAEQLEKLSAVEAVFILQKKQTASMKQMNQVDLSEEDFQPIQEDLSISCLISQHRKELLDQNFNLKVALKETLDDEFESMLLTCLFVPLIHKDTPRNCIIPKNKEPEDRQSYLPNMEEVDLTFSIRNKMVRENERKNKAQKLNQQIAAKKTEIFNRAIENSQRINRKHFETSDQRWHSIGEEGRLHTQRNERLNPLEKVTGLSSIEIDPSHKSNDMYKLDDSHTFFQESISQERHLQSIIKNSSRDNTLRAHTEHKHVSICEDGHTPLNAIHTAHIDSSTNTLCMPSIDNVNLSKWQQRNAEQKQKIQSQIRKILAKSPTNPNKSSLVVETESRNDYLECSIEGSHEQISARFKSRSKPVIIPKLNLGNESSPRLIKQFKEEFKNMTSRESPINMKSNPFSKEQLLQNEPSSSRKNLNTSNTASPTYKQFSFQKIKEFQRNNEPPLPFEIQKKLQKRVFQADRERSNSIEQDSKEGFQEGILQKPRRMRRSGHHHKTQQRSLNQRSAQRIEYDSQILLQSSRRNSQSKYIINEMPQQESQTLSNQLQKVNNENYREMKDKIERSFYESQKREVESKKKSIGRLSLNESNIFETSKSNKYSEEEIAIRKAVGPDPESTQTLDEIVKPIISYNRYSIQRPNDQYITDKTSTSGLLQKASGGSEIAHYAAQKTRNEQLFKDYEDSMVLMESQGMKTNRSSTKRVSPKRKQQGIDSKQILPKKKIKKGSKTRNNTINTTTSPLPVEPVLTPIEKLVIKPVDPSQKKTIRLKPIAKTPIRSNKIPDIHSQRGNMTPVRMQLDPINLVDFLIGGKKRHANPQSNLSNLNEMMGFRRKKSSQFSNMGMFKVQKQNERKLETFFNDFKNRQTFSNRNTSTDVHNSTEQDYNSKPNTSNFLSRVQARKLSPGTAESHIGDRKFFAGMQKRKNHRENVPNLLVRDF